MFPHRIRPATPEDAAAIARVHTDAWRETYSGRFPEEHFSEAACLRRVEMWTEHLTDRPEGSRVFVAEASDDGRIIGFGSAGLVVGPEDEMGVLPARGLQLFTLYVLASAHGTGVGHGLIDALIGTGPAQLWVLQGNERAIAFYRRNGFTFDGVRHVHPTLAGVVDLRMVR